MIKTRVTKLTITPAELFHERGFSVEIVDEAGGEFVKIRSNESGSPLRIDADEWPFLRDAIDRMFVEIAENESEGKLKELLETPATWEEVGDGKQAEPAETSKASGGWIPWSGGKCPVGRHSKVHIRLRSADFPGVHMARDLRWEWAGPESPSEWDSDNDIITYKVVE